RRKNVHRNMPRAKLQAAAPAILGAFYAAVTAALSNTAATAESVSRFADVHHWTTAAALVLGLISHQINVALAANPIVDALHVLFDSQPAWTWHFNKTAPDSLTP